MNSLAEEKKYYESILTDIEPHTRNVKNNVKTLEREIKTREFVDFKKVQEIAESKAKSTIGNFVAFFIPDEELRNSDFLKTKIELDKFVLGKVMFQVETCDFAMTRLLEVIDEGMLNPRNFEVLAGLQKSSMEMIRFLVQLQNVIELTYRNYYDSYLLAQAESMQLTKKLKSKNNEVLSNNIKEEKPQLIRMKHSNLLNNLKNVEEAEVIN